MSSPEIGIRLKRLDHGAGLPLPVYATAHAGLPPTAAFVAGVLAATLVSAIFGLLAVRTSGVYFLLLTLALGMIVWGICLRWTQVTGGENGMRGDVRPALLLTNSAFYWAVLASAAVVAFAMWRFVRSPFGLTLRGIRDSESRRLPRASFSLSPIASSTCEGSVDPD